MAKKSTKKNSKIKTINKKPNPQENQTQPPVVYGTDSPKVSKNEVIQVRLDPKLKFAAELCARRQRRKLSSFIRWAVEEVVRDFIVDKKNSKPAHKLSNEIFSDDELLTFVQFIVRFPELATPEDEKVWDEIIKYGYIWKEGAEQKHGTELRKQCEEWNHDETLPDMLSDYFSSDSLRILFPIIKNFIKGKIKPEEYRLKLDEIGRMATNTRKSLGYPY